MAYLHCHSCDFSQDDFWSRHYNPIRCLGSRVRDYAKPRFIDFDQQFYGPHRFSWMVMLLEFRRVLSRFRGMKWWTNGSWKRAIARNGGNWPNCPKCRMGSLCID